MSAEIRPEVVALWLDTIDTEVSSDGQHWRWIPPEMWCHRSDGTYLTEAERDLLGSMRSEEAQMGVAVAQARADQATADAAKSRAELGTVLAEEAEEAIRRLFPGGGDAE